MSQNDFNLANQGFPAMRADMNSAFQALASNSSGATEPGTTYAYQWWYDTNNDILKMRNADDDAWINIASFDQTNDTWTPYVGSTALTATAAEINQLDGNTFTADVVPNADSTLDLGSSTKAWALAYIDAIEPVGADTTIKRVGGTNTTPIVEGVAKAWVNFNGTGTIAVRDSLNVSGAIDNGTGNYSFSFSSAMGNVNYSVPVGSDRNAAYANNQSSGFYGPLTTGVSAGFGGPAGTSSDPIAICIAIHGDLA